VTISARFAKKNAQKTGLKASSSRGGTTTREMITTAMKTEDSFEFEGVKYHAIARKTCGGCSFEFLEQCTFVDGQPYCMAEMREDGRDIVWQVEPCAP
jgi:hypothetical protein